MSVEKATPIQAVIHKARMIINVALISFASHVTLREMVVGQGRISFAFIDGSCRVNFAKLSMTSGKYLSLVVSNGRPLTVQYIVASLVIAFLHFVKIEAVSAGLRDLRKWSVMCGVIVADGF